MSSAQLNPITFAGNEKFIYLFFLNTTIFFWSLRKLVFPSRGAVTRIHFVIAQAINRVSGSEESVIFSEGEKGKNRRRGVDNAVICFPCHLCLLELPQWNKTGLITEQHSYHPDHPFYSNTFLISLICKQKFACVLCVCVFCCRRQQDSFYVSGLIQLNGIPSQVIVCAKSFPLLLSVTFVMPHTQFLPFLK